MGLGFVKHFTVKSHFTCIMRHKQRVSFKFFTFINVNSCCYKNIFLQSHVIQIIIQT
jgi:hypothetical protein